MPATPTPARRGARTPTPSSAATGRRTPVCPGGRAPARRPGRRRELRQAGAHLAAAQHLAPERAPGQRRRWRFMPQLRPAPGPALNLSRYRDRTQLEATERLPGDYALCGQLPTTASSAVAARFTSTPSARAACRWLDRRRAALGIALRLPVEASGELRPGLTLRAQMLSDPRCAASPPIRGGSSLLAVVADFAVTLSGLARGGFRSDARPRRHLRAHRRWRGPDAARLAGGCCSTANCAAAWTRAAVSCSTTCPAASTPRVRTARNCCWSTQPSDPAALRAGARRRGHAPGLRHRPAPGLRWMGEWTRRRGRAELAPGSA